MKVVIIHDWLTGMRGGERVLEEICTLFPDADLYTLIHIRGSVSSTIEGMNIRTSFLQLFPKVALYYRYLLLLMPKAIESFNLSGYDLIISSSHCVAKGVFDKNSFHVCYCHTPVRYAWDKYDDYFGGNRGVKKILFKRMLKYIRDWDRASSSRVDCFIANSKNISSKIKRFYGRYSEIIYPPVDTNFFGDGEAVRKNYFLIVSAFVPYKRLDIAIEAFNLLGYSLKIVGSGEDEGKLRATAGANIEFLGSVDISSLRSLYSECRALIFPGEEDFGIVAVEAQSSGTPVIAYNLGGVTESVIPLGNRRNSKATGIFFKEQTPESIIKAVYLFEKVEGEFDPVFIREHSSHFSKNIFREKFTKFVQVKYFETLNEKEYAEKI